MQPALGVRALTSICWRCNRLSRPVGLYSSPASNDRRLQTPLIQRQQWMTSRSMHSTPYLGKKKDKAAKRDAHAPEVTSSSGSAAEDPYDYSELESSIAKAHVKLKDDLSKLRAGGKFNPELVENLKVQYDKGSKETARLGDLAQCVPRGRVLNIIAGDKDHIKAISSAIQTSDLSLNPQPDSQNPLQLNVQLPSPTTESRKRAVQDAIKLADEANVALKNARGAQQKRLRSMQLSKAVRPDDLKKASDKMEKIVADGTSAAKKILDNAKKILESG